MVANLQNRNLSEQKCGGNTLPNAHMVEVVMGNYETIAQG